MSIKGFETSKKLAIVTTRDEDEGTRTEGSSQKMKGSMK